MCYGVDYCPCDLCDEMRKRGHLEGPNLKEATPQSNRRCENCRFFDVDGVSDEAVAAYKADYLSGPNCADEWWIQGECHKNAPYVYVNKWGVARSRRPGTKSNKSCGEWEQKQGEESEE